MEKSGSDTAFSFPVGPRRIIAARAKLPSPERTLEAGRAKIRLWNERHIEEGRGEGKGRLSGNETQQQSAANPRNGLGSL